MRHQFAVMSSWWSWTDEDRRRWTAYAQVHLVEAAICVHAAYQDIARLAQLGIDSAEGLLPSIQT